jgi:hypothetical protein
MLQPPGVDPAAPSDPILDWNRVALDAALIDSLQPFNNGTGSDQSGPTRVSRALAIVHIAMSDAFVGIEGGYQPFPVMDGSTSVPPAAAPSGADTRLAVASAAHFALVDLFGLQEARLDNLFDIYTDQAPATAPSVVYGRAAARRILDAREDDGSVSSAVYTPTPGAGNWRPDPLDPMQRALDPHWGGVDRFVVTDSERDRIRPPAPPALETPAYAEAVNEVRRLGELNSEPEVITGRRDKPARTPDQTRSGVFWSYDSGLGTPVRLYNQNVRTVAKLMGNTVAENARLFALVNVALADAGIVCWEAKYEHELWRPIHAVREVEDDGNDDTDAEPGWTPYGKPPPYAVKPHCSPPFPAYVSGHATFGAAAFQTLIRFYGTDECFFTLTSDEIPGHARFYQRFSDAIAENGRSRIYLGVHFDFDDFRGQELGREVGNFVYANAFRPS